MTEKDRYDKESHDAAQEAMREVVDQQHRAEHEEHLLRYLSGIVYHNEHEEAEQLKKTEDAVEAD
jgi:hypothetical protein